MSMAPRCGKWCSGHNTVRVPRIATGTTGTPVWAATTNAPMWKGRNPGAYQSAFGEDDERPPASHRGSQPIGVSHAMLALVAFDELVA